MRRVGALVLVGTLPAAILLGTTAWAMLSVHAELGVAIGIGSLIFLALTIWRAVGAVLEWPTRPVSAGARWGLSLAPPLACLGSALGCMGLTLRGCAPACGFLIDVWIPLVSAMFMFHAVTGRQGLLPAIVIASFGLLIPNCRCYNPINGPWIEWLGLSPACYLGGYAITLFSVIALGTGWMVKTSLLLSWTLVGALFFFWIGHHYFRFPW